MSPPKPPHPAVQAIFGTVGRVAQAAVAGAIDRGASEVRRVLRSVDEEVAARQSRVKRLAEPCAHCPHARSRHRGGVCLGEGCECRGFAVLPAVR